MTLSQELAMTDCKIKGLVHAHETFGAVDGPGVRYVVFLQGCAMRCMYCHNPETWAMGNGEWKAEEWDAKSLFDKVYKYKTYWGKNLEKGGITVSGGEPLLQIDFVIEFFKLAKAKGVHTALDTSAQPFKMDEEYLAKFDELMKYTDLVMLDLKAYDNELHKRVTGFSNENIFQMAKYLSDKGKPMWIRRVLVPGLTDGEDELKNLGAFIKELKTVEKVELLPYHTLGLFKWKKLGIDYPLEGVRTPTKEEIQKAKELLGIQ